MSPMTALVVDDEPLARRRLARLLAAEPRVRVVAECPDGNEALASIRALDPDIVFLDVRMPGLDGLGVVESLAPEDRRASVVFVTAWDDYAVRAFEVEAADYLVKPVDAVRLRTAIERVATRRNGGGRPGRDRERVRARLDARPVARLLVRDGARATVVPADGIDWVEAAGNYVRIHRSGERPLLDRRPLNELETLLDSRRFARIHRSTLVNLDRVESVTPGYAGGSLVRLVDGTELTLSRRFRRRLFARVGSTL